MVHHLDRSIFLLWPEWDKRDGICIWKTAPSQCRHVLKCAQSATYARHFFVFLSSSICLYKIMYRNSVVENYTWAGPQLVVLWWGPTDLAVNQIQLDLSRFCWCSNAPNTDEDPTNVVRMLWRVLCGWLSSPQSYMSNDYFNSFTHVLYMDAHARWSVFIDTRDIIIKPGVSLPQFVRSFHQTDSAHMPKYVGTDVYN